MIRLIFAQMLFSIWYSNYSSIYSLQSIIRSTYVNFRRVYLLFFQITLHSIIFEWCNICSLRHHPVYLSVRVFFHPAMIYMVFPDWWTVGHIPIQDTSFIEDGNLSISSISNAINNAPNESNPSYLLSSLCLRFGMQLCQWLFQSVLSRRWDILFV